MRKIISGLFISLDGVVEAPDQWHFPYFNDEMGEAVESTVANADTVLFGRRTFTDFQSYWPEQGPEVPFSSFINNVRKYVVSTTLTETTWADSSIISGDVAAQIRELKASEGKDISITGSGTLVMWLLRQGLLDELRLLVHPIIVGEGKKRLFDDGERLGLELVDLKVFKNGVTHQIYAKADIPENPMGF
ncbi:dihydrofolate reductase [Herbidospora sp. NEAU-GS84]|uniref:Dihydrofolate reductase n=1 Tax=Herbidospora solisilvae TaxID=2696284 RepID=A0A7C9N1L2_9ACTN|nr:MULTISPECIES: dihydrofolate reductase family protein [Herbidospora]NAS23770.1 dihydrofolate reductase [Herbidospora solisilvae]GLX95321.1 pyrimidine reductase [Herbidospora sp. NBRC 101105]